MVKRLLALFSLCLTLTAQANTLPSLVIIIDDLGHHPGVGEQVINLPGVTLSILPHTGYATQLARQAHQEGKEVMLHLPMANLLNHKLGPGGLTEEMDQHTLQTRLIAGLDSIPHIQGVNNHMGSLLTQKEQPMQWVMDVLSEKQLYFVDSRTSPDTVAFKIANKAGIPTLKRHVFLDNQRDRAYLEQQFDQALKIAHKIGIAVLIGHPYPETISFLQERLDNLEDIELKTPSQIFAQL